MLTSPNAVNADDWRIVGVVWLAVWLMNGTTLIARVSMTSNQVADTNWRIVGVGDYNRDGKPDLIWRDTTSGGAGWIGIWLMDGTTLLSSVATNPENHPLTWRIRGPK